MSLTNSEALELYNNSRPTAKAKPSLSSFKNAVLYHLFHESPPESDIILKLTPIPNAIYKRIERYCYSKRKKSSNIDNFDLNYVCISPEDYSSIDIIAHDNNSREKQPLNAVSPGIDTVDFRS